MGCVMRCTPGLSFLAGLPGSSKVALVFGGTMASSWSLPCWSFHELDALP